MRPVWSGALSFGLINIPIRLYSASYERTLNLDMLHKKDLSPIRYAKICKAEEKEVPYEEIVKGYEYEKGEYVIITDEDFELASSVNTKLIEIDSFVNEDEVDTMLYDKPYFLEPGKGASKAYSLLNEALKKSNRVGVGIYVFHTKQHVGLIKPHGKALILQQLRYVSELKDLSEIELPAAKAQPKELNMALKLIEQMEDHFQAEKYKDTHTEELMSIIAQKTKGKKPPKKKAAEPKITHVDDLMAKLKASLHKTPYRSRAIQEHRKTRVVHR